MEDEKALSYYSYRMTSVTERVKNLSIVWNYRRKMYIYFVNCLQAVTVSALREYQIANNLRKKKIELNVFSIVGFDIFLLTKE